MAKKTGTIGTNITFEQEGNVLTLKVDLSQKHGQTAKGFDRIASTGGNMTLPDGQKIGLNIYSK